MKSIRFIPLLALLCGLALAMAIARPATAGPGAPTIAGAMADLNPLGYYPCSDTAGPVLAADPAVGTLLGPGTVIGFPAFQQPGGLFGVPGGGSAIALPSGSCLRIPTGPWLASIGTPDGCWIALKFKLSGAEVTQIAAARNIDYSNGIYIDFNFNRAPWPGPGNQSPFSMSVSATDAAGKAIVNVYLFDELRHRDGQWHDLAVRIVGGFEAGSPAVIQFWFDGLLLVPAITERTPGYDFRTVLPLGTTDLVVAGSGVSGVHAPYGGGITVQSIGLGTGPLTDAQVLPLSRTMWYTDSDGCRWDALWEPSPATCFLDAARTIPCPPLTINSVGPPVRAVTDSTGNGYHLKPNWLSELLQPDPSKGCPNLARDESGAYYLKFNNVGQTRRWLGSDMEQYVALDVSTGAGGKMVPALMNVHGIVALSQQTLFQATPPRLFNLSTSGTKGSAAFARGRPAIATNVPHSFTAPAPVARSLPSISFCSWMAGAAGHRSGSGSCLFFVDGSYTQGSMPISGTYLTSEPIGGSTVGCYNGGTARFGYEGFSGRLYRLGVLRTPWNQIEVNASYAAYLQRYGVSDPPEAVMVVAGDSITSHEHSLSMDGWQTRLIPNGNPANWRRIALHVNATPGVRLHGSNGYGIQEYAPIADPDYWHGLTSARTTFLGYLGTNDSLQAVDGSLSVASYSNVLSDLNTVMPPGIRRRIGMTIPGLIGHYVVNGQDNKALINGFLLGGAFDQVVITPEYPAIDGIHPNDTGMAQIAAAGNASGAMDAILAPGVCCRGATCSSTIPGPAHCQPTGAAGAIYITTDTACGANATPPCCLADYNKTGGTTVADIFAFLTDWFAASPAAQTGGTASGTPAVTHIFSFLSLWFAGGC